MKLTRAQFLKALPAAALVLAGCTAAPTAPADTDELVFDHAYPLDYATQFTADCYADGSTLLTIPDAQAKFLIRPEGAATLRTVPAGVTVLQQPVQNIYLVSTSAMDLFLHLDALDSIALSGTRAEGWYLDEAKQAMQAGRIAYAGKYSAPDYERILTAECGLAVENTMIYHTPEVKEQLERFGIPVLVERSSYESSPLARMEWIKLYGILLGKEALAEEVFAQQAQRIAPLLEQPSTGKRCAFFSITSSGLATVRKSGDYVAQMIGMAGGEYVFADLAESVHYVLLREEDVNALEACIVWSHAVVLQVLDGVHAFLWHILLSQYLGQLLGTVVTVVDEDNNITLLDSTVNL